MSLVTCEAYFELGRIFIKNLSITCHFIENWYHQLGSDEYHRSRLPVGWCKDWLLVYPGVGDHCPTEPTGRTLVCRLFRTEDVSCHKQPFAHRNVYIAFAQNIRVWFRKLGLRIEKLAVLNNNAH